MRFSRALRLGVRREVQILLPIALFLLALVSLFTLWLYRNAVNELAIERRAEARAAAERLAAAISDGGLPTATEFDALAPQALHLALLNRQGQPILERGSALIGDQLAPFRDLDVSSSRAIGPDGALGDAIVAVAPAEGELRQHIVRVDLRARRLAVEQRRLKLLTWLVVGLNAGVLLVVIFFARSLLEPYDALLERARQAQPEGGAEEDEIDFLMGTFERALGALQTPRGGGVEEDVAALERTLGPSLESGLLVIDRHRRLLSLNPVGRTLLGRRVRTPGTSIETAVSDHPELLDAVQEVISTGDSIHRREIRIELDDQSRTLGLTAHPLRRDDGSVRGYLLLFADLTEARRRAEEEQLATSLTQVGELAAGVAHELRNSLATLKGYLRLVERAPDEESIQDYLGELHRESDHLQRVLEDFLSFARPGTTRLESLDLATVARRAAADPALEGTGVEVVCDDEMDTEIKGDAQLLERAVRNLLHNAAEAERQAGAEGPLRVEVRAASQGLSLLIEDRGPGVSEEVRQRLFRPFATGRADGVGLGLALARRIVDLHGGRLSLEPRPLGGTRAVLEFPRPSSVDGPGTNEPRVLPQTGAGGP